MEDIGYELSINGCKVKLNFLTESNEKALDTAKKILTSSLNQNVIRMEH